MDIKKNIKSIEEWLGDNNKLGIDIWKKKYQFNDETFEEWLDRITNGNEELKQIIFNKEFIFGGRILANRGLNKFGRKITYSNCYVLDIKEDSIEGIYDTCAKLARTYSYGGGCGIDISILRPCGAIVNNAAKTTSGAVSFMSAFDNVTSTIGQNGRRGALMISIDIKHPDVIEFIDIKNDVNKVNSANISVRVDDEFMKSVENNEDYYLRWPCNVDNFNKNICADYNVLYSDIIIDKNGNEQRIYLKKIKAQELFNKLCVNNWNYAEPGILYWDRIEGYNMLSEDNGFHYAGVNPCAEEPLPAGGSCLLGSINLSAFVNDGVYDFERLSKVSKIATDALNEVLIEGLDLHPLEIQRKCVGKYRQIGLGIMGLADTFIKMGIRYGSDESLVLSDKIASTIANAAVQESIFTGEAQGMVSLNRDFALNSNYFKSVMNDTTKKMLKSSEGLFNSQILTIAPTGTISTMWNISGGIEPIFALSYERLTKSLNGKDTLYTVYPEIVKNYFRNEDEINIKDLPDYFVCSSDISIDGRIKMQSIWQKYIDASISSTVNLPELTTVDDVKNIYMSAWKNGLKGITIFRSGCKRSAILTNTNSKKECNCKDFLENSAPKRPKSLPCKIVRFRNNKENWVAAVGLYEGRPYEIFTGLLEKLNIPSNINEGNIIRNKIEMDVFDDDSGKYVKKSVSRYDLQYKDNNEVKISEGISTCFNEEFWNYGKLVSGLLRHGMPIEYIVKVISTLNFKNEGINTWKNGVIRSLKKFMKDGETDEICPECGSKLIRENGCIHCPSCGWSKCG